MCVRVVFLKKNEDTGSFPQIINYCRRRLKTGKIFYALMKRTRLILALSTIFCRIFGGSRSKYIVNIEKIPIVFVFSMPHCRDEFPHYLSLSLEQALVTQPEFNVILLGDFIRCPIMKRYIPLGTIIEDIQTLYSNRTHEFHKLSSSIFSYTEDALWITATRRFFYLEDLMNARGYKELIHVEGDNLIYGNYSKLVKLLRYRNYRHLAATPLTKHLTTASVLWIGEKESLEHFNNFLLALLRNNSVEWSKLINHLRKSGFEKLAIDGGLYPDENGLGVKPVNRR